MATLGWEPQRAFALRPRLFRGKPRGAKFTNVASPERRRMLAETNRED